MQVWLQLLMALIGTTGFALLFHIKLRNLPAAGVGGIMAWGCYLLLMHYTGNELVSNMTASFIICIWAEIMARIMKAPVNVFMITGLIPLIPGAGLYYTMLSLINRDWPEMIVRAKSTGIAMLGIAIGIVAESVIFLYIRDLSGEIAKNTEKKKEKRKKKKQSKKAK